MQKYIALLELIMKHLSNKKLPYQRLNLPPPQYLSWGYTFRISCPSCAKQNAPSMTQCDINWSIFCCRANWPNSNTSCTKTKKWECQKAAVRAPWSSCQFSWQRAAFTGCTRLGMLALVREQEQQERDGNGISQIVTRPVVKILALNPRGTESSTQVSYILSEHHNYWVTTYFRLGLVSGSMGIYTHAPGGRVL